MISLDDIEEARVRVRQLVHETPVLYSDSLTELCGRPVYLKCENLQRTGSYKVRGAYNMISQLPEGKGVVAASAGNHAQGVALAASATERDATIFMPSTASLPKVEATRGYGATVHLEGSDFDTSLELAIAYANERDAAFVPPFDHPHVIAGQGTVAIEILEQVPDVQAIVGGVGGGGLMAGVSLAAKSINPNISIFGVEPQDAASMRAALDAGKVVTLDSIHTMADGLAARAVGELNFEIFKRYVDDVVTVSEEEISNAVVKFLERKKLVVEPGGAVPLAALQAGRIPGDGPVVLIVSGGNVDPFLLISLIDFGLSSSGRYLVLRVILDDRPGQLADLSRDMTELGLNIIDVEHHRAGLILGVREVEIRITVETRNPEHKHQVVDLLTEKGWRVDLPEQLR